MPISSNEISQMVGQANAGFAQNQAYAQGLTHANPLARYEHNLGAGIPGGNSMVPGGPHAAQAAPGMMQSTASGMGMAGFGVTLGAAFGILPRALDPFTQTIHTMSAAHKAAGMGGAIGGALAVGGAYLAVGQAATYATGKIIQGAQEQAHSMGQFSANLGNSGISGMGGMGGMQGASDAIQGISSMGMSAGLGGNVNVSSVGNVMAMGMQGGQFRGVKGAAQFKQRLSKLTAEATAMANMLGSSIEEASSTLQGIEQQFGLKGASAISFVGQMGSMQGASGMGVTQQMAQAQFGSGMFQSMGLGRAQGARYGVGLAQRVGASVQMGAVGRNAMADIGGQEQATARFTQSAVQVFSGRDGMRLLGAMMDENGELDTSMAFRIAQGGMSKKEITKEYKKRVKGKGGRGMLLANRAELIGGFMEEQGPEGALSAAEGFNAGSADSEFKNLAMSGLSGREMDVLRNMRGQAGNMRRQMYEAARRGLAKSPSQGKSVSDLLSGMMGKVLQPIEETFTGWGRDIHSAVTGMLDDISRDIAGKGNAPRTAMTPARSITGGLSAAYRGGGAWAAHQSAYGPNSAYQQGINKYSDPAMLQSIASEADNNPLSTSYSPGGAPSAVGGGGGGAGGWSPDWDRMAGGHQSETWLGSMVPSGMRYAQRGGDPSTLNNFGMFPSLYGAEQPSDFQSNMLRGAQIHGAIARAPGMMQGAIGRMAVRGAGGGFFGATGTSPLARAAVSQRGGRMMQAWNMMGRMRGGGPGHALGSAVSWAGRQVLSGRNFMAEGAWGGKVGKAASHMFKNTGWMKFGGRGILGSALSTLGWATKGLGAGIRTTAGVANKAFWPLMFLDPISKMAANWGETGESGDYAQGITGDLGSFSSDLGGIAHMFGGEGVGSALAGTGYDPNTNNAARYTFMGSATGGINRTVGEGHRAWVGAGSGGMGVRVHAGGGAGDEDDTILHKQMWVDTRTVQESMQFLSSGIHNMNKLTGLMGQGQSLALMKNDLTSLQSAYESNLNVAMANSPALEAKEWQKLQENTYIKTIRNASRTGTSDGAGNSPGQINANWTNVINYLNGKDLDPKTKSQEVARLMNLGNANSAVMSRELKRVKNLNLMYKPGMTGKALKDWQGKLLRGSAAQLWSTAYKDIAAQEKVASGLLKEYQDMETNWATKDENVDYDWDVMGISEFVVGAVKNAADEDIQFRGKTWDAYWALKEVGMNPEDFKLDHQSSSGAWFGSKFEEETHFDKRFGKLSKFLEAKDKANKMAQSGGLGLLRSMGMGAMDEEGTVLDRGAIAVRDLIGKGEGGQALQERLARAGGDWRKDEQLYTQLSKAYRDATLNMSDAQWKEVLEGVAPGTKYKGKLVDAGNIRAFAEQELMGITESPHGKAAMMQSFSVIGVTKLVDTENLTAKPYVDALRGENNAYHSYTSATGYTAGQAVKDSGGSAKTAKIVDGILNRISTTLEDLGDHPGTTIKGLGGEVAQDMQKFREELANMGGEELLNLGETLMDMANSSGNSNIMEMAQVAIGYGGFKSGRTKGEKKKPGAVVSMGKSAARMLGLKGPEELALVGIGKGAKAKRIRDDIKANKQLPLSSQLELARITRLKMASAFQPGELKEGGGAHAMAQYQLDVVQRRVYSTGEHEWFDPHANDGKGGYTTDTDTAGLDDEDLKRADVVAAGDIGMRLGKGGKSKGSQKTDAHVANIISNVEGLDGAIAGFIQRLTGK